MAPAPRVVRLCSVFEPPASVLAGRGVRFDPIGGMQTHTACLTRALDARGVVQDVVTTRPPGAPRVRRLGEHATVHRVGLPVRLARQLYALPAARLVNRLGARADLLHAHLGEDLAVVPIALGAALRFRLPLVLTVHMSLAHTLARRGAGGLLLRTLGGPLELLGATRADAVVALTPRLAALLASDGVPGDRVHVVPSGVLADAYPPARQRRDGHPPRVLFVGRLVEQKGLGTLLEAAGRLRTPGAELVVVGDGPERRRLERRARRLGVRLHVVGFRPHREIPSLLADADVLALPSRYEELGLVLLEAMQAGLPVVASRVGGIPDAVGDAGVLVPTEDPLALAGALDGLLADPAARRRLAELGRRRVRAYEWDVLAERVLEIYRGALDRGHALVRSQPPPAAGQAAGLRARRR